ncbi:MAG: T9SS type A sorting domain-containing protein [Bacteroidales bacterium]|nr:T9SS type A sorting domain-containing protein [Bacteroidales bacterium]
MRNKLLLAFMLCSLFAKAQTIEVSGPQSGRWEADTILITNNVVVQDSLSIMPGTTVLFNGFFNITVGDNAMLNALGTRNDSILFTVADTTGFSIFNSGRGGWNGIRMENAGRCRFDYCRFQYGKAALDSDQDGGALRIFNSQNVEISHSTLFCNFSREHGGALNAEDSKVVIHDCDINNNLNYSRIDTIYFMYGGGLRFLKCEVDITKTDFRNNYGESAIGGALSIDSCVVRIDRCRFEYNYGINGAGLYMIRCFENPCSITNSLFANNTSGHFGGGLAISDSSPLVSNLTVVNNQSIGVNCGGIFFYQNSSPVLWNCIVYGNLNDVSLEEPVQMWSWTFEGYAPEFHNCLVQYGYENISNNEVITVYENCLDEDPLFSGLAPNEYTIGTDSPCYNTGSPYTPIEVLEGFDLTGQSRVYGGVIDIGAYEVDPTGVMENTEKEKQIRVVGNPITASSYAEIECENACNLNAKVYSLDGKLLVNKNLGDTQVGLNRIELGEMFQNLSSGSYLLVIQVAERTHVAKVIKP